MFVPHEIFLQSTDMPSPGLTLRCLFSIRQVLTLTKNQSLLISKTHFVESKLGFYQLKKKNFLNNNENLAQNLSVAIEVTIGKKITKPKKQKHKPMFIPFHNFPRKNSSGFPSGKLNVRTLNRVAKTDRKYGN